MEPLSGSNPGQKYHVHVQSEQHPSPGYMVWNSWLFQSQTSGSGSVTIQVAAL